MGIPDDFREFLVRQTEAEAAFHQGDAGPRMQLWSHRDPVSLFGAAGMFTSGWDELREMFPWVAARFSEVTGYRYDLEVADVVGDMGYAVGYERFTGSIDGRPAEDVTVRSTHVYRREQGEWRIVHRHGDNPPAFEAPTS
jgi:ketosteroid isomerase-like protein